MNAASLFAIFGVVVAFLAGLAAVVAYLRGTAVKADLQRLRDSNQDLRDELGDKERRLHDAEVELEHLKESDAAKSAALARIGQQAASGAEMAQLAAVIKESIGVARDHDREAAARHAATIRSLRELRTEIARRTATEDGA